MIHRLLLSTILIALLWQPSAQADKREISFSGISPQHKKELQTSLPNIFNGSFSSSDLDEMMRRLMESGDYENIYIHKKQTSQREEYLVEAFPIRKLESITVSGNNEISQSQILNSIALKSGERFSQRKAVESGELIRSLYAENGYYNTVVEISFANNLRNNMDVNFQISENHRCLIAKIDFQSDNSNLARQLYYQLRTHFGDILTEGSLTEIKKDAQHFFAKNGYLNSDLTTPQIEYNDDKSKANLTFQISNPILYRLDLEGSLFHPAPFLAATLGLTEYYSTSPNFSSEISEKIKSYYLEQGFADVSIKVTEKSSLEKFKKVLAFQITEGNRIRIESLTTSGRFSRSNEFYIDLLKSLGSDLFKKNYYNRDQLDAALKEMIVELKNQGYLRAKLVSHRALYDKDRKNVSIVFTIDEGPLTIINKVQFQGIKAFPPETLTNLIDIKLGQPLKLSALESAFNKIKDFYHNQGYLEMDILNEEKDALIYNEDGTEATINLQIYEGPILKVGSIIVEGNETTKEFIVLVEIDFKPGDILTPKNLDESVSRLQRIGLFSDIQIRTLEEKTGISERTVIIKVKERNPGVFNSGIGVSTEKQLTLRGFTGIAYRNLDGVARSVSTRADLNTSILKKSTSGNYYPEYKVTGGFAENYLFRTRTQGSINLSQERLFDDFDNGILLESTEATFSLERYITSHIRAQWKLWEVARIRKFTIGGEEIIDSGITCNRDTMAICPLAFGPRRIATTGPILEIDYRDHPFNPTKGTFSRFTADYSAPSIGSDSLISFVKTTASFTHYFNPAGKVVWANSLRGGILKNISNRNDGSIPYPKIGFTLGGRSTIRGFDGASSERIPNNTELGVDEKSDFGITTESQYYLIKSEVRFPIWNNIGGAVFYDGGSVKIKEVTESLPHPYRHAAGVGFHYGTPLGAFVIDYACKLDRKNEPSIKRVEDPCELYIAIGTF